MARTWLSIRVDLVEGHGEQYWPRPGRIFAAARSHTFGQLADAIDDAFARWDRSQLQEFTLAGQTRLCRPDRDREIEGEITEDYQRVKLSRLGPGEQFVYVFDLGDDWAHLCTVGAQRIDPVEALGILPGKPLPYWGWETFPTSTGAGGTATTATHPRPPTPGSLIFHRSGLTGGPPADGRGPGSRHCSRASAHLGQHQPAPPGRAAHRGIHARGRGEWSLFVAVWRCSFGRVSAASVGYRRQVRQAQDMETGGHAFVAVDVHYLGSGGARAAAVVTADDRFSEVVAERTEVVAEVLPYRPGDFYLRELPPIRAVLSGLSGLSLLVVDGYADLDSGGRPGLGAHAHAEFDVPVIGVAKSAFPTATHAVPVLRGTSVRPLFVTAAGMPRDEAVDLVRHMAGQHRLPDAIRRADTLARTSPPPNSLTAARLTKRGSRQNRAFMGPSRCA